MEKTDKHKTIRMKKTYENTTSDNETCALGIQKVFTFKKKSKMVQKCLLVIFVL